MRNGPLGLLLLGNCTCWILDLAIGSLTIRECATNDDPPEKTPGLLSMEKNRLNERILP